VSDYGDQPPLRQEARQPYSPALCRLILSLRPKDGADEFCAESTLRSSSGRCPVVMAHARMCDCGPGITRERVKGGQEQHLVRQTFVMVTDMQQSVRHCLFFRALCRAPSLAP
jgi:hypothetical protein